MPNAPFRSRGQDRWKAVPVDRGDVGIHALEHDEGRGPQRDHDQDDRCEAQNEFLCAVS